MCPIWNTLFVQLLRDNRLELNKKKQKVLDRRLRILEKAKQDGVIDATLRELADMFSVSINTIVSDLRELGLRTARQLPKDPE